MSESESSEFNFPALPTFGLPLKDIPAAKTKADIAAKHRAISIDQPVEASPVVITSLPPVEDSALLPAVEETTLVPNQPVVIGTTVVETEFFENDDVKALYVRYAEAQGTIERIRTATSTRSAAVASKRSQMKIIQHEMQQQLNALSLEISEGEAALFDERRELRAAERLVLDIERELRLLLEGLKAGQAFKGAATEFDKISAGHYWREFAMDHQIEGGKLLALSKRAILGDKRGLGKSLTSLIYADMLQSQKLLIVLPADIVSVFRDEIEHWAPHRSVFTLGKMKPLQRRFILDALKAQASFTVVINYQAWRKDKSLIADLIDLQFDTVICDEAHEMKKASTNAFRGVREIVHARNCCAGCSGPTKETPTKNRSGFTTSYYIECGNLTNPCGWAANDMENPVNNGRTEHYYARCSVKNVLPMTGTPILNKPQDLFTLLNLVDPINFQTERDYLNSFCSQDYYTNKWVFRPGGLESLVKRLGGKYVARDRQQAGVIIPKQSITVHELEFDNGDYAAQRKVIDMLNKHGEIMLSSGDSISTLAKIALITRLRQANVWPGGISLKDAKGNVVVSVGDEVRESMKLDKIVDMLEELTVEGSLVLGERVVVFSQFKTALAELEERIKAVGITVCRFDGDQKDEKKRDEMKADFDVTQTKKEDAKWQVILCNYKTGGVGLNFTGASEAIMMDEEWNPGKEDQAMGRIDRIGTPKETNVHILRIKNTIDDWLAELIEQKAQMIGGFEHETDLAQMLLRKFRGE